MELELGTEAFGCGASDLDRFLLSFEGASFLLPVDEDLPSAAFRHDLNKWHVAPLSVWLTSAGSLPQRIKVKLDLRASETKGPAMFHLEQDVRSTDASFAATDEDRTSVSLHLASHLDVAIAIAIASASTLIQPNRGGHHLTRQVTKQIAQTAAGRIVRIIVVQGGRHLPTPTGVRVAAVLRFRGERILPSVIGA